MYGASSLPHPVRLQTLGAGRTAVSNGRSDAVDLVHYEAYLFGTVAPRAQRLINTTISHPDFFDEHRTERLV
jgi:hypothetical protein